MAWPLADRLDSLLSHDLRQGTLVIGERRAFQILRAHYARELGIARVTILTNGLPVFEKYEALYRRRRAAEIKAWLMGEIARGSLPLRDGAIEHKYLQSKLSLSDRQLYECAEISEAVANVNRHIKATGYAPNDRKALLQRLRQTLSDDCPLDWTLLRVSSSKLAERVGTTPGILKQHPFRELIQAKTAQLSTGEHLPNMVAFLNDRAWDFRDLSPLWPEGFVSELARQFTVSCEALSEPRHAFASLKELLRWIGQSERGYCLRVHRAIFEGHEPRANDWDDAVHGYAEHVQAGATSRQLPSVRTKLSALRTLLDRLAQKALVPNVHNKPRAPKNATRKGTHIPTVAQATKNRPHLATSKDALTEFARTALQEAAVEFELQLEEDETLSFLQVIQEEADRIQLTSETGLAAAVLRILDVRLGQLKAAAADQLAAGMSKLEEGRSLLGEANVPDNFYPASAKGHTGKDARHALMRAYFPAIENEASRRLATANMLAIGRMHFKDRLPSDRDSAVIQKVGQFFQKRYMELGGRPFLQGYLTPSPEAQAAALTLYLIDSGPNLAVGLTLPLVCEHPSEAAGYVRITGKKERAGGKPIHAELRKHSPTAKAIRWVADTGQPLRDLAAGDTRDLLFVRVYGEDVKPLGATWYRTWFHSLVRSIPELADSKIVPSMIRPSVLVKAVLERNGSAQLSQAIGQHGLNQSQTYQSKLPVVLQRTDDIRRFQLHEETVLIKIASNGQPLLCINEETLATRVEQLVPTGLAGLCVADAKDAGTAAAIEVELTPDVAFTLQGWKSGLLKAQPDWERDRSERWQRDWLPFLCLISLVEDFCMTSSLVEVWDAAAETIEQRLATNPAFKLPCPF